MSEEPKETQETEPATPNPLEATRAELERLKLIAKSFVLVMGSSIGMADEEISKTKEKEIFERGFRVGLLEGYGEAATSICMHCQDKTPLKVQQVGSVSRMMHEKKDKTLSPCRAHAIHQKAAERMAKMLEKAGSMSGDRQ